jgi:hypothetical protein
MVIGLFGLEGSNIDPDSVGMIYENMSEAGPRSINGYPMFMSCKLLNKTDTETVIKIAQRIQEAVKSAL